MKKTVIYLSLLISLLINSRLNASSENVSYSRTDLIKMTLEKQVEIFITLDNSAKLGLYLDKLNLMKSNGSFNAAETQFIDRVISEVSPNIYNELSVNVAEYKTIATTTLGWTEVKWGVIFESLYTPEEFYAKTKESGNGGQLDIGGKPTHKMCHCRWSLICFPNSCDANANCNGQSGCGFLGAYECDGRCDDALMTDTDIKNQLGL